MDFTEVFKKFYVVVLIVFAIVLPVRIFGIDCWNNYRLTHYGVQTVGTIVAVDPQAAGFVEYRFVYNGKVYQARQMVMDRVRVGATVLVTFDPARPTNSTVGNPSALCSRSLLLLLLIFLIVAAGGFYGARRLTPRA
jgi:hypothetical protein